MNRSDSSFFGLHRASQAGIAGLLVIFTLVWFSNLESRKLVRPDEGRYAEIAREMAVSGDWVTPRLNGLKYFEKPPLQYWATAAMFRVSGESHWAARWWPATTAFVTVLLMFWTGCRLFDTKTGLAAAAALGGCTGFVINTHLNTLDGGLAAFLTIALLSFILAQHSTATAKEQRNWMRVVWVALALAVLSKGLIGLILPGAVLVIYIVIERDWRLLTRLRIAEGGAIFLLLTAPWFIAVSWSNDEFARFFFIHEHFERFLTNVHKREGGWWYFIPILLFGAMPWTPLIALRLRSGWRHAGPRGTLQLRRLLLIWATFIFLFFSASHSKLPSYILPMFPALALFVALETQEATLETLSNLAWGLTIIGGVLFLTLFIGGENIARAFSKEKSPFEIVRNYIPWILASVAVFTAGAGTAAGLFQRQTRLTAMITLAFSSLIAGILVMNGHDALSRLTSSSSIVREFEALHEPQDRTAPFFSVQMYDQTLPFYLRRTVTLVQYIDEFALGLAAEPDKGIPQVEDWKQRWIALDRGYAIMNPENYARFVQEGLPMRELARDPRRVIVSRQ